MAAFVLTAVVTNPNNVSSERILEIQIEEKDPELIVRLDQFSDLSNGYKKNAFSSFNVSIKAGHLNAENKGEMVNKQKHDQAVEVKGGTLTQLKVSEQKGNWIAQCVVDV